LTAQQTKLLDQAVAGSAADQTKGQDEEHTGGQEGEQQEEGQEEEQGMEKHRGHGTRTCFIIMISYCKHSPVVDL
jgi:hypothetical protein